jgi:hypothetical protein
MNTGTMITNALNRCNLSVNDYGFRMMATDMLNEIVQEHFSYKEWKFKKLNDSFATVVGQAEYPLNKRLGSLSDIIDSSFRGSDPVRTIGFMATQDFYKQHPYQIISGTPYKAYPGQVRGVATDPSAASVITFTSSFTNYTTGTATVVQGSNRVIFAGATMLQNWLGGTIRFGTDQQTYRLIKRDFQSSTIFYLDGAYQNVSSVSQTYVIGDVAQWVTALGYVGTKIVEEEVQLNGSTPVATTNSFTTLTKISKSDRTMGYITATSNAGGVTNVVLDAGENEVTVFGINLYPTPTAIETITYEFVPTHPILSKFSDTTLFPAQYHPLLQLDLYIKLISEWLKMEPTQEVLTRREKLHLQMIDTDNNTDNWKKLQETEYMSTRAKISNLPPMYGTDYDDQAL